MSRLRYIFLFISTFFLLSLSAQKAYKPIRAALKSKNATQALQLIAPLTTDSSYRNDSRLYEYAISAYLLQHENENTKAYLKQKYDTLLFFNSSLGIIKNILLLDSLDQSLQKKKAVAPEYTSLVSRFLPHINSAGRYCFQKRMYPQAITFFTAYLAMPSRLTTLAPITEKKRSEAAYLCTKSYYLNKEYPKVTRYKDILLPDTTFHCTALEYYTLATEIQNDSTQYLSYLNIGIATCPSTPFFFTRLIDFYISQNKETQALALADSLLATDSTSTIIMEGRCLALIALHKYRETIKQAQTMLRLDSTAIYPNYYIGLSYCNLANQIELPNNITSQKFKQASRQRNTLYRSALPYLEKFKVAQPEQQKKWAPLLYKVYLSIEDDAKFKEMDAILQTLNL